VERTVEQRTDVVLPWLPNPFELKVLAETWDEYMRTPQFLEMMKASPNGSLNLKRVMREGINWLHE
jgi:hypothetical protein